MRTLAQYRAKIKEILEAPDPEAAYKATFGERGPSVLGSKAVQASRSACSSSSPK